MPSPQPTSRLAPALTVVGALCASLITCGCGRESKVEQIRRGAENVHHHAREIERESQSPAGAAPDTELPRLKRFGPVLR